MTDSSRYPGWPVYAQDEIAAVTEVLRSGRVNYWTGSEGRRFEQEFAALCGCRYGVALANGTLALEAALHGAGIGPGDEVIVPARTFVATAGAVALRGAVPVFADVDEDTQGLSAETIEAVRAGRARAVIVVHLAGRPVEMDPILALARRHDLIVIEDCAQAHGATYNGSPVGGLGDVAAFSFCQDKIMSTGGEGGMIVTDDAEIRRRAWAFKDHGKHYDKAMEKTDGVAFRWLHDSLGTNARMTEVQAAIGRVQLGKLEGWLARRRANADVLSGMLDGIEALRVPRPAAHIGHAYYKFYAFVDPERLAAGWSRDGILEALRGRAVPCGTGVCPEVYLERVFREAGLAPAEPFPTARRLGETSMMLPVHPTLEPADMEAMAEEVKAVMEQAGHDGRGRADEG